MKNTLNRVLMAAAITFAAAGSLWAGDVLNATVPFQFSVGGTTLAAGDYSIGQFDTTMQGILRLRNNETGRTVLTYSSFPVDGEDGRRRLVFRCGASGCALVQIWNGSTGYELKHRSVAPDDKVAVIYPGKAVVLAARAN
jgi:hypothetical protein